MHWFGYRSLENSIYSSLMKEKPLNSSPLMFLRMYLAVSSGGVLAMGSLLNWESKFSALRGSDWKNETNINRVAKGRGN